MKNLNNYIQEKYLIDIDTNISQEIGDIDKVFDDIYELVDTLNIYLKNKIKEPIKIIENFADFKFLITRKNYGILRVNEHFNIISKRYLSYIRAGIVYQNHKKDMILVMQLVTPTHSSYTNFGPITPTTKSYHFGKDNFKEWLSYLDDKRFSPIKYFFGI